MVDLTDMIEGGLDLKFDQTTELVFSTLWCLASFAELVISETGNAIPKLCMR